MSRVAEASDQQRTAGSATISNIVGDIYRICIPPESAPIGFNQFLIADERPTLIHTGYYHSFDAVRAAVAQVLDPRQLAYVVIGHFESDECGGMCRFLEEANDCVLVASEIGASVNLNHWDYRGPVKGMQDGDVLDLGRNRLRFLETPHVHHWDSLMVLEESTTVCFRQICLFNRATSRRLSTRISHRKCWDSIGQPEFSRMSSQCGRLSTALRGSIRHGCIRCTAAASPESLPNASIEHCGKSVRVRRRAARATAYLVVSAPSRL